MLCAATGQRRFDIEHGLKGPGFRPDMVHGGMTAQQICQRAHRRALSSQRIPFRPDLGGGCRSDTASPPSRQPAWR
ncbi:hypothetical protein G6F65_021168 [Rhizopus arrhizus]|nr:hypothetical protein G6F65_021168 [Rhizopus arrhizus]